MNHRIRITRDTRIRSYDDKYRRIFIEQNIQERFLKKKKEKKTK